MPGTYRTILSLPGVPRLAGTVVAAGLAAQGTPVALVLLGRNATGSFAAASALLAAATVGGLAFAPAKGRLVDRLGPSRALGPLAAVSATALVALVAAAHAHAPLAAIAGLAATAAAASPPVVAVMRSTWRDLLVDGAARHAGFGLLTVMQEITFFGGPLIAGAVVGIASPETAVLTMAALGLVATLGFATAPAVTAQARAPDTTRERSRVGVLASPGMRTLTVTGALAGATFGLLDVALPALARAHGAPATAGVLLAAIALGIGVGGFVYGLVPPRRPPGWLYGPLCALAALGLAPLIPATAAPLALVTGLLMLTGLLFAPLTTCQLALIDDVAPRGAATEAMAVLGTAYGACSAAGAQAAGVLIDGPGLRAPFVAACACIAVAAVLATARRQSLLPRPTAPPARATIERA